MEPLKPCPYCGAAGAIQHLEFRVIPKVMAECGNNIDCKKWPMTKIFATAEEAAAAWNRGEIEPVFES